MAESTTGVAALVAVISGTLLALLGVDYYALLWATIASLASLLYAPRMTRGRAGVVAASSAFLGAALGTAAAEHLGGSRSVLMVCAIVCATGSRPVIVAFVDGAVAQIKKRTGVDNPPPPPNNTPDA